MRSFVPFILSLIVGTALSHELVTPLEQDEHHDQLRRRLCTPSIELTKTSFAPSEDIKVIINVCSGSTVEWFGIWSAGSNVGSTSALNWQYTCGGQSCNKPQSTGAFIFALNAQTVSQGSAPWPLQDGRAYKVYYNSAFGTLATPQFSVGSAAVVPAPTAPPPTPPPSSSAPPPTPPPSSSTPPPTPPPSSSAPPPTPPPSSSAPPPTPPPSSSAPPPTPSSTDGLLPLVSYGSTPPGNRFPLGRCKGDCDSDSDCAAGLYCYQRDNRQSVPGCSGGSSDNSRTDYCVSRGATNESSAPPPTPPPSSRTPQSGSAKKLKLYWNNYYWQETRQETFWCMTCADCDTKTVGDGEDGGCNTPKNDKCEEGHLLWIRDCQHRAKRFEFIHNNNSGDQIRVSGTNLCFSAVSNKYLELRPCNASKSNQLWTPHSNRNKFELRPYDQRGRSIGSARCLSTDHHPKDKEVVGLWSCKTNIADQSNYWNDY